MSIVTVLKTVGKDLSHVGTWIEDGLKVAEPIVGAIDPPIGAIITQVEGVISSLMTATSGKVTLTAASIQSIVTSIAMMQGINVGAKQLATTAPST